MPFYARRWIFRYRTVTFKCIINVHVERQNHTNNQERSANASWFHVRGFLLLVSHLNPRYPTLIKLIFRPLQEFQIEVRLQIIYFGAIFGHRLSQDEIFRNRLRLLFSSS